MNMSRIPKLRFKEFGGEWNTKKLNEITTYVDYRGKSPQKSESGIFLVTAKNIKKGFIDYESSKEYVLEEDYQEIMKRGKPQIGDVLLTTEAPLGNVAQIDNENIALAQRVIKFSGKDNLDNTFLKHYFLSDRFQNLLESKAIGTTVLGIQGKVLHHLPLQIPEKSEQQKIASFLSAVDTKIDQLTCKKELLEQYKKGVMQKIFSQELRFKADDGSEFPEWEEKTLGMYIDLLSGFAFKGEDISENTDGIPLLRGINITEGAIRHTVEMDRYFCGEAEKLKKYFLETNDLVISMDGSKVGKNSALISEQEKGSLLVQRVARIRANTNGDIHFIYQIVRSSYFIRYVDIVNTSSGIPHISAEQIKNFPFYFPKKEEQTKIASFFSAIDTKIDLVAQQLDEVKNFKKGLLQQMFV